MGVENVTLAVEQVTCPDDLKPEVLDKTRIRGCCTPEVSSA